MLKSGSGGLGKSIVPIAAIFGIPLALGFAASLAFDHFAELRTSEMQREEQALADEKNKVLQEVSKLTGFEKTRDEIEGNLRSIRGKMETIERLIQNRDGPTKALIYLSQSIPPSAWLTDINFAESSYDLRGGALDPALVTDFIARLQKTIYFTSVQLRETTSIDQNSDKVSFSLSGSR
jgi:Tfp pilus assembly protein PilN